MVKKYLKKLGPVRHRIEAVWLFGSRARGDYAPDSDYDLLLVVDKRDKKLLDVVYGAAADMLLDEVVDISAKVFPRKQYDRFLKLKTPFIGNVFREGIRVV